MTGHIHTYPINDVVEHETDGDSCWCGPQVLLQTTEAGDIWQVIHNSVDGREHHEPGHDKATCPRCQHEEVS